MYEMLTGVVPFLGDRPAQTLTKHVSSWSSRRASASSDLKIPATIEPASCGRSRRSLEALPSMKDLDQSLTQVESDQKGGRVVIEDTNLATSGSNIPAPPAPLRSVAIRQTPGAGPVQRQCQHGLSGASLASALRRYRLASAASNAPVVAATPYRHRLRAQRRRSCRSPPRLDAAAASISSSAAWRIVGERRWPAVIFAVTRPRRWSPPITTGPEGRRPKSVPPVISHAVTIGRAVDLHGSLSRRRCRGVVTAIW